MEKEKQIGRAFTIRPKKVSEIRERETVRFFESERTFSLPGWNRIPVLNFLGGTDHVR